MTFSKSSPRKHGWSLRLAHSFLFWPVQWGGQLCAEEHASVPYGPEYCRVAVGPSPIGTRIAWNSQCSAGRVRDLVARDFLSPQEASILAGQVRLWVSVPARHFYGRMVSRNTGGDLPPFECPSFEIHARPARSGERLIPNPLAGLGYRRREVWRYGGRIRPHVHSSTLPYPNGAGGAGTSPKARMQSAEPPSLKLPCSVPAFLHGCRAVFPLWTSRYVSPLPCV